MPPMGFPTWTLYGMGIGAFAALVMIALAYIGQSPRFMRKLGLDIYRLDLRVRAFTGYAFAFLLIAFGFFLAGVPLDGAVGVGAALVGETATPTGPASDVAGDSIDGENGEADAQEDDLDELTSALPSATFTRPAQNSTPVTGAFGGPPPGASTATATESTTETEDAEPEATAENDAVSPTPRLTNTVGASTGTPTSLPAGTTTSTPSSTPSPTPTETPSPTVTPTPTFTPTPIVGETAVVDSNGSNVWVYRSPGGQQLTLVGDGDVVILLPGHANQGGVLWQEIMTVEGFSGWIEASFLEFNSEGEE